MRLLSALLLWIIPVVAWAQPSDPPYGPQPLGLSYSGYNSFSPGFGVLYSSGGTGAVTAAGTGYVPGDSVTLTGGTATTNGVLAVTDTLAVSGTVAAGGSGGTNGACTVTGTTGTGTKAQFTGTVSGNALTGPLTVAVAGDYTVNPTAIAAEPVTGCSLTGAQVNMTMGALAAAVTNVGNYSVAPTGTISQGSTSGSGTGATFSLSFGAISSAFGYTTLSAGNGNLFIGGEQPLSTFHGTESTFIGDRAGGKVSDNSSFLTFVGHDACGIGGGINVTGVGSTICVGTDAGRNVATGATRDIIIGASAAEDIAAADSVVIGNSAASTNLTSGQNEIVLGSFAGGVPTSGSGLVIIGYRADGTTAGTNSSVIIGGNPNGGGAGAKGNSQSVVIGAQAGNTSLTGANNTLVGFHICNNSSNCTTGTNNIILSTGGTEADLPTATTSNYFGIQGNSSSAVMTITGTNAPTSAIATHSGPLVFGGTKFTTSGCSVSATSGNGTSGTYTSGTSGTCTVVLTLNGATGITAPTGWACYANDLGTPADKQGQTASSQTTATISGTTVSGDVVNFACLAY